MTSYFRPDLCAAAVTGLAACYSEYSSLSTLGMSAATFWGVRRITQVYKEHITQDLLHLINRCQNMRTHIALPPHERLAIANEWNRLKNICWTWGGLHQTHLADIRSRMPPSPSAQQQADADLNRLIERCRNMQAHIALPPHERLAIANEWNRLKNICWSWGGRHQAHLADIRSRMPPSPSAQQQADADLNRLINRCRNMRAHILLPSEERAAIVQEWDRLKSLCWTWGDRYREVLNEMYERIPPELHAKPVCRILPLGQGEKSYSQLYRELKNDIMSYYNGIVPPYIHLDDRHEICYLFIHARQLSIVTKNHHNPLTPYQNFLRFGDSSSSDIVPTFYQNHDVYKCYPERFLRCARRIAPQDLAEVEQIIIELKNLGGDSYIRSRHLLTTTQSSVEKARGDLHKYLLLSRLILYHSFHESPECLTQIHRLLEHHGMRDSGWLCYNVIGFPPPSFPRLFQSSLNYAPIAEILLDCPLATWNSLISRGERNRSSEESALMTALCDNVGAVAHGVRSDKGGLVNLMNIMLEGSLRPDTLVADLGDSNFTDPSGSSGIHGPFYVILGREIGKPTAYLVPYASDKALVIELLQIALRRGMLTTEERDGLISKLHTIPEYIQAHRQDASS